MKLTDLFVKRPVLAIVVNLVILIAGLQAIRSLSVRQYPRSDIAVVQVTTIYVGANADLVRGFITTPLERVIASADGIDYMESTSAQGLSTIIVHLKLNYDTNAALTQIQAKVAQVRNDLPPEAEAPVIDLQTADNAVCSDVHRVLLDGPRPEPDHRLPDPRGAAQLSAVSGVQRADILGDRTFAMRIWLKPDKMAALNISPSAVHDALANNNYLSALGSTKGSMVSVNLVANTDLRTAGRIQADGGEAGKRRRCPPGRDRRCRAGRGELRLRSTVQRRDRDLHGHLGTAHRQLAGSYQGSPRGHPRDPGAVADGNEGRYSLRLHRIHSGRDRRSAAAP